MSNELSIFKNGAAIPSHYKVGELSATTKALMGGSGGRRISVRGNIFRMVVNGQEVAKNDDRAMNIVIAAAAPHTSRQYYAAVYQEGENAAPTCWSVNGEKPDVACQDQQAATCAACPKNIAGSGQGKTRACRYSHKLAVLMENDVLEGELYELALAATSLFGKGEGTKMPLMQYAKLLGSHGMNITDVVTEMRFDTDSATPKLTFRAVRPLELDELEAVRIHGESPEAKLAITPIFVSTPKAAVKKGDEDEDEVSELVFAQPKPKAAVKTAAPTPAVEEPVVRKTAKASTPPPAAPADMESLLAEWAD